jgi:type IV secretion system protein VirB5
MKRLAFVIATSIALLPSAHAIDVTISPAELTQMAAQLTNMKAQLQQAQQQYMALTGSSGIGSMLSGDTSLLRGNLPSNWNQVYADAMNSSSSVSGSASSILSSFQGQINGMGRTDALAFINQKLEEKGATDRAMGMQSYNNEMAELNNIQTLTDQIDRTTTPKEIMDLQARIQTAQGSIQGEQAKLRLMAMLQQSQDKLLQQQQALAVQRYTIGTSADDNTTPDLGN